MAHQHSCRVFVQHNSIIRSFYWFGLGSDQSVYFGPSNTKQLSMGLAGRKNIDVEGATIEFTEGRSLEIDELKAHHSIHSSGIVNNPNVQHGLRDRYQIARFKNGIGLLPLVSLLPRHPSQFPATRKIPKMTDIVVDLGNDPINPIGMLFYINNFEVEPEVIKNARTTYTNTDSVSIQFGINRLSLLLYSDPRRLTRWPAGDVAIKVVPDDTSEPPDWGFFSRV